jgi:hypothetical protein
MHPYFQEPAKRFEQQYHVTGIAGNYIFPKEEGYDRESIHRMLFVPEQGGVNWETILRNTRQLGQAIGDEALSPFEIPDSEFLKREYIKVAEKNDKKIFYEVLGKLETLNPDAMQRIGYNRNKSNEVRDVICGIVSGFSPEDIHYFIHEWKYILHHRKDDDAAELHYKARRATERKIMLRLSEDTRHGLGWIASPQTMQKIWEQIEHRVIMADTQPVNNTPVYIGR